MILQYKEILLLFCLYDHGHGLKFNAHLMLMRSLLGETEILLASGLHVVTLNIFIYFKPADANL